MWKRLLLDPPQHSPVLCLEGTQWVPPYQPLILNLFCPPQTLPLKVIIIQEWAQLVIPGILLPEAVVVFKVAARETGTEAEVEGNARSSPGDQGGVETLNQCTLVPLMYPLVGMEATKVTTGGSRTQLDA